MADVITLSSSEDESVSVSPPRKRIKPTQVPILANLPQVTITKVSSSKIVQKDDIVLLCSDDDENENNEDEVTYIDAKDLIEIDSREKKKIDENNELKLSTTEIVSESSSDIEENEDNLQGIKDLNNHSDLLRDLEDSCEIINEDSCAESSGKENRAIETAIKNSIQPCSSSAAGKPSNTILLGRFIKLIDDQIDMEEKYKIIKEKFPLVWKYYNKCEEDLGESTSFKNMLSLNIQKAEKSAALAVVSFNEIFQHLRESVSTECIEVEKDELVKLKKLEKTIKRLVVVIKQLEQEEIDFDEEENSSFLKLERYLNRLDKVYKKYCQLMKKNPFSGRLTYSKLDFVDSEFNEINRAISKKFKNNKKFPSYYEMEKFIEKVVEENKLDLSESKIKNESVHCFKKLGELLQNRRRKELYDVHHMFIKDSEDPAKEDTKLGETLKNNYLEGQLKIEKLVEEYVQKESTRSDDPETNTSDEESDRSECVVDSEDDEKGDQVK